MATTKELSVEDKLRAIYDLQIIDTRIDEIRNVRGELPLEVDDLEDESDIEITFSSETDDDDFQDDNMTESEIYEKEMSLVNENIHEKEKLLKNIESNQKIMEENL